MSKFWPYLLAAALMACTTHRDYLVEFRLQGTVQGSSAATRGAHRATIQMVDTGMDEVRSEKEPIFLRADVQEGAPFTLGAKYFWGSEARDAFQKATLTVRVDIPGCGIHEQKYRLAELAEDGEVLVLDLRTVTVPCKA